jgi:hypothetical protein
MTVVTIATIATVATIASVTVVTIATIATKSTKSTSSTASVILLDYFISKFNLEFIIIEGLSHHVGVLVEGKSLNSDSCEESESD